MNVSCPEWLKTAVFYQVYPQSFCDSNGDGIGDLPGLIEKLDYIKHLGCNAIWVNPCFVSPFGDAGYDVADYYEVAPRYGTNADLKRLFEEAAKRGIKVCLDLVPGHTSSEHAWFKESCKADTNRYTNWYIWTDSPWNRGDGHSYFICGHSERNGSYMPNFFYHQPALNFGYAEPDPCCPWQLPVDHPDVKAVREELKNIIKFWLKMGASGFRVDMAYSLVKNDRDCLQTIAYWREVREMIDSEYPEAVLIAEWSNPYQSLNAGFHGDFLLIHSDPYTDLYSSDAYDIAHGQWVNKPSYFRRSGGGDLSRFLDRYCGDFANLKDKGFMSFISGNHDSYRISINRTNEELEVLFAFLMTMPGIPFIYYGDEIGMQYVNGLTSKEGGFDRTGSRTPMQWDRGVNAGFSAASPEKLYIPMDSDPDRPNVADQLGNPDSLMEKVRALIALRLENPLLCAEGDFEVVYSQPYSYPFVYKRFAEGKSIIVALNPSEHAVNIHLDIPENAKLLRGQGTKLIQMDEGCQLEMDGVSYGIYEL